MIKINYIQLNETEKYDNKVIQVPVKLGSHRMLIRLITIDKQGTLNKSMKPKDLVELVFKKCNMKKYNSKTYSVFESFKGVERFLKHDEDIIQLMKYWTKFIEDNIECSENPIKQPFMELVIRKLHKIEVTSIYGKKTTQNPVSKQKSYNCQEASIMINPANIEKIKMEKFDSCLKMSKLESKNLKRKASETENSIKKFFHFKELIHSFEYKIISRNGSLKSLNSILSHTNNLKDSFFEKLFNNNKQFAEMIQYKKQRCEYQKYFTDSNFENAKLIDSLIY
jgi:hypothetical protein